MFLHCCSSPTLAETLSGRVALVTGASSGIGLEFARQLAPYVKELVLVARRLDRLDQLRRELARPGLEIRCYSVDLADREALGRFLTEIEGMPVDFLVNNAGLGDHGFFESSPWPRVEAMLEVNIRALTRVTHALLPGLLRAKRGAILNVSSVASLLPVPQMAVYAATKAYVTSFSEALRAELRGTGIVVTALCPGPVETEFSQVAARPHERDEMGSPELLRVPPSQVVREALHAVAADRARIIPGWFMWSCGLLLTLVPFAVVRLGLSQRRQRARRAG